MTRLGVAITVAMLSAVSVRARAQDANAIDHSMDTTSAVAQSSTQGAGVASPSADTSSRATSQSVVVIAPSGLQRQQSATPQAAAASSGANLGPSVALMAVGAGAIVLGAIIGGQAGTIFMVGGGVVGLYGLWKYLQ